jgi:putative PIN family toxin of toxin-antitoxin system
MRVVPDANIIIAGLLWRGSPRRLIGLAHERQIELYGSEETYAEFCRIVQYERFQKHLQREIFSPQKLIVDYRAFVKPVSISNVLHGKNIVAADPDDDAYFSAERK